MTAVVAQSYMQVKLSTLQVSMHEMASSDGPFDAQVSAHVIISCPQVARHCGNDFWLLTCAAPTHISKSNARTGNLESMMFFQLSLLKVLAPTCICIRLAASFDQFRSTPFINTRMVGGS